MDEHKVLTDEERSKANLGLGSALRSALGMHKVLTDEERSKANLGLASALVMMLLGIILLVIGVIVLVIWFRWLT